jgi:hypothetical protein
MVWQHSPRGNGRQHVSNTVHSTIMQHTHARMRPLALLCPLSLTRPRHCMAHCCSFAAAHLLLLVAGSATATYSRGGTSIMAPWAQLVSATMVSMRCGTRSSARTS